MRRSCGGTLRVGRVKRFGLSGRWNCGGQCWKSLRGWPTQSRMILKAASQTIAGSEVPTYPVGEAHRTKERRRWEIAEKHWDDIMVEVGE